MTNILRKQVIKSYINLLRTERNVFGPDMKGLGLAVAKTRETYRLNKEESDQEKIQGMIDLSYAVSDFLKTNMIQAERKNNTVFELKLKPETNFNDQYEFIGDQKPARKKRGKIPLAEDETTSGGCCGGGCGAGPSSGGGCQ
eukprot:gene9150-11216_t